MWENDSSVDDDAQDSPLKFFTLVILAQPQDVIAVLGANVSFTASFFTNDPGSVTYAWQIQTGVSSAPWEFLVEQTGYYEGVATTTLDVKAVDNYLATRASCNFRCVASYRGLPTFTNSAALSIPIHYEWIPGFSNDGAALNLPYAVSATAPQVVGFSGPFTYHWDYVSGTLSSVTGVTSATPQLRNFAGPAVPAGNYVSYWTCTISNGSTTLTTEPLMFVLRVFASGAVVSVNEPTADPETSLDGAAIRNTATIPVGPWEKVEQRDFRRASAAAAITINTPAATSTGFSLNGPDYPGTCVCITAVSIGQDGPFLSQAISTGNSAWGL